MGRADDARVLRPGPAPGRYPCGVPGRSVLRSVVARIVSPVLAALDRRLEALAARLERHTTNLSLDQRAEIARIDERLTLDVAVISEHLVGIERIARGVTGSMTDERVIIALPGEPLRAPAGARAVAYAPNGDGTWRRVADADGDENTLRVVRAPASPGV